MIDSIRRPSRRRWLAGALVVSLAINAFFVAAVATDMLRLKWGAGRDREARALRFELRWFDERLDREALGRVEAALAAARPDVIARTERLRQLRNALAALAAAGEPDRAAIDAQLAAIRAEVAAMQAEVQDATMDALLALPPEARARLAEAPDAPK
jgi:Spy/CpxP family protein refolding chaperone